MLLGVPEMRNGEPSTMKVRAHIPCERSTTWLYFITSIWADVNDRVKSQIQMLFQQLSAGEGTRSTTGLCSCQRPSQTVTLTIPRQDRWGRPDSHLTLVFMMVNPVNVCFSADVFFTNHQCSQSETHSCNWKDLVITIRVMSKLFSSLLFGFRVKEESCQKPVSTSRNSDRATWSWGKISALLIVSGLTTSYLDKRYISAYVCQWTGTKAAKYHYVLPPYKIWNVDHL